MSTARLLERLAAVLEEHRVHVGAVPSDPIRFSDLTFAIMTVKSGLRPATAREDD